MHNEHPETMLEVKDLNAWYGESHVLHGMSFSVRRGEVVTLIGRNGAGKTTTMRSIMGVIQKRKGSISFLNKDLTCLAPHHVPRLGLGYVPEERGIFSSLNVMENLTLPPKINQKGMSTAEIFELFPNLKGRDKTIGTRLSGGEQQMLAIARVLRTGAEFILLDEPTEGLAPAIINQIAESLQVLKQRGLTILLVEQNLRFAASIADRHYVVDQGMVVDEFSNEDVSNNMESINSYLTV